MAEDLQHLLKRIRSEALDVSNEEAETILSGAKHQAAAIVHEAEVKARALMGNAEVEAAQYTERSVRALEQAARDLLITIGQGVQGLFDEIIGASVGEACEPAFFQQQLDKMISAYLADPEQAGGLEVRVSPAELEAIRGYIQSRFQSALSAGVTLRDDAGIQKGFRVSYDGSHAYHDFTDQAVAEALSAYLRPHLAEIVHRVATQAASTGSGS